MSPPRGSAGPVFTLSTEILVASVIFLFVTVVFVVFLYLYVKHRWGGHAALLRRVVVFEADPAPAATRRGLDPAVLSALPVTIYRSSDTTLECAVCLCHVSDGEKARLLPRCSHGFHLECIDMWFRSHSTCPLCRSPVHHHHVPTTAAHAVGPSEAAGAAASLPSNGGLSWGTHHDRVGQQGASLGLLVIEIPAGRQQQQLGVDDDEEEMKTATSLKGLWRMGKREDVSVDVEQGFATAASASAPPHSTQE